MSNTDWNAIEAIYRAGAVSIRELAATHGPNESTIRARAKREGWVRGVTQKPTQCAVRETGATQPLAGELAVVKNETTMGAVRHSEDKPAAPGIQPPMDTAHDQAVRIGALEARVKALEGMMNEAGELFRGLVNANKYAMRNGLMTGPLYPWITPTTKPTRWG